VRRNPAASPFVRLGKVALVAFAIVGGLVPLRAPATVQEQRARLPPPAECDDPVAGIWKSHSYDESYYDWTIFTLDIHRKEGSPTELEGTISNHSWLGPPEQSQPGVCEGLTRYKVSMDAAGTVVDNAIVFTGHGQWRLDGVLCGEFNGLYNLDSFSGTIDPDILEFQSVNNDGGRAVNYPVVFRRVACHAGELTGEDEARIAVAPPPFYPPEDEAGGGCGCFGGGK
jgi:hypothetical protein